MGRWPHEVGREATRPEERCAHHGVIELGRVDALFKRRDRLVDALVSVVPCDVLPCVPHGLARQADLGLFRRVVRVVVLKDMVWTHHVACWLL